MATISQRNEFQVLTFTQGKMTEVVGVWYVYEKSDEISFEVNGECVFNHKKKPCMWHGFVLEYDSNGKDVSLSCIARQNMNLNVGNPSELTERARNSFEYSIPLKGNESVFANAQYIIHRNPSQDLIINTTCSVNGLEVLKFKQQLIFGQNGIETCYAQGLASLEKPLDR